MLSQVIDRKLAQTRNYLRLLFTALGVSRVLLATLVVVVVSLFLDWMLEFPQAVRAGLLVIGLVAIGYCVIRFLYRPLETTLRPEAVAMHIEETHPQLQDGLVSALDLRKDPKGEKSFTSPELIEAALQWTESAASEIEPRRVKKAGPVAFVAIGSLLLTAMLGGFFNSRPAVWDMYVQRMLLLGDVPWPRHTTITLEGIEDGDLVVPSGGSLTIRALVEDDRRGVFHEFAEIYSEGLKGATGRLDAMHQEPRNAQKSYTSFSWTFSNINESFSFEVYAGDAETPARRVLVKTRPRVEEIASRLFYPLHLAKPATPEDDPIRLQTIRTVMGTRVQSELTAGGEPEMELIDVEGKMRATLGLTRSAKARSYFAPGTIPKDAPLRTSTLRLLPDGSRELHVLGAVVHPLAADAHAALRTPADSGAPAVADAERTTELTRHFALTEEDFHALAEVCGLDGRASLRWEASASKSIGLSFDVRAPTVFFFKLTSNDGFTNIDPVEFTVQAQPDREPAVRMIKPGRKTIASTVGKAPLVFTAEDDFGLRSASLILQLNREGETTPLDSLGFPVTEQATSFEGSQTLLLAAYQLKVGDRVTYWAQATDFYDGLDHVGRSHQYQIQILSEDDILRSIQGRLNRLLDQLETLIEQEKEIQTMLNSLRLDGSLSEQSRRGLLLVQTDQRRVGDNLGKISVEFGGILDELVNNEVGDENDRRLYEDARNITDKLSSIDIPTVLDDIQLVRKAAAFDEAVTQAFARMNPRVGDVIFELEELLGRLQRWDQVTELSRLLSKIREEQIRIKDGIDDAQGND